MRGRRWPACRATCGPSSGLPTATACASRRATAQLVLPARLDPTLAAGTVRVPAGHPDTAALGAMFGPIRVEAAEAAAASAAVPANRGGLQASPQT